MQIDYDWEHDSQVHGKVKPHVCATCNERFPRSDALRNHQQYVFQPPRKSWPTHAFDVGSTKMIAVVPTNVQHAQAAFSAWPIWWSTSSETNVVRTSWKELIVWPRNSKHPREDVVSPAASGHNERRLVLPVTIKASKTYQHLYPSASLQWTSNVERSCNLLNVFVIAFIQTLQSIHKARFGV